MHKHKKKLGQHFIHDKNLINKIIRYIAPMSSDEIIEIGPGDGALSYIISKDVKKLILIEKDTDLISELKNGFKNANLSLIHI